MTELILSSSRKEREKLYDEICRLYKEKKHMYKGNQTGLYVDIANEVGKCWQTVHRVLKLKKML